MKKWQGIVACLLIVLAGIAVLAAAARQTHRVDDSALRDAGKHPDEWLTTSRDYAETRYSPLDQINTNNVSRLGLAWYYDTGSDTGALEATPTVSNGILYGTLPWSVVFAVDARTGKEIWRYDPKVGHHEFAPGTEGTAHPVRTGPTQCCGPVNRGVALYDGKVYVGILDGRLAALDAKTGKVVWIVATTPPDSDYTITGAPRIVKGKVIVGNGGAEFAVRGYVSAYDAETGSLSWRFYIVPGDPSKPQENKALDAALKTWTGDTWWKMGGGGTAWDAFAYDPELDLLYVGTGNGGPWSQHWRSPGGGDNLYLSSIVALRPETGELAWYFQETPGDEWDYTATQGMTLADLNIDGRVRKVIMQSPKNGFFYVLDRETGKFISAKPIAQIGWATGVDPKTGRPIENPTARYDTKGSWVAPSGGGVHSWHAMSFNPSTGLVYIPGSTSAMFYQQATEFNYRLGRFNFGLEGRDFQWIDGMRFTPGAQTTSTPTPPNNTGIKSGSFVVAWDPVEQKERWRVAGMNGGGTFTTAGNLVFVSANNGRLVALSADKGEKLWESQLVSGMANPSTYMVDGKQYVSVLAGTAGHGKLYTFVLDGNASMPSWRTLGPGEKSTQNGVYTDAQAEHGKVQYTQQCAACHGADLTGAGETPALAANAFISSWNGHSADTLFDVMHDLMPKDNPGGLSPEAYVDIMAYIFQVNHFPAGKEELTNDQEELKKIIIMGPPGSILSGNNRH